MYKKILVPMDGSQLAEAVLRHVEELASAYNPEIILARVVVPAYTLVAPEVAMLSHETDQALFSQAEDYLKGIAGELREKNLNVRSQILEGPIAESLLDFADSEHVDLICMSTHGRSGIGRWVYGSVADRVLQGARCPIMLIRAAGN